MSSLNMLEFLGKEQLNQLLGSQERIQLVENCSTYRRINVHSGRPLEPLANYSRALRVGDMVLQSGTTAIDTQGNIIGEVDIAKQVDAIMDIAQGTLAQAGASLDDVVRRRDFTVVGAEQNRPHGEGPGWFKNSRPVSMGCRIAGLALPEMLVEVDAWAVKGAHQDIEWLRPG
jgi:enamine deaminase RidA (YjgF/YER057c/UK114 family)